VKILLVENGDKFLKRLKKIISGNDLDSEIINCTSGQALLEITRKSSPDIIIMDFDLPDMESMKVLRCLKDLNNDDMYIIILLDLKNIERLEKALDLGISDWIDKSSEEAEFMIRVKKAFKEKMNKLTLQDKEKSLEGSEENFRLLADFTAALKEEYNFISAIVDTVCSLVIVLDPQGRIIRFNQACEQLTGYSFEEVKNKCFWDIFLDQAEVRLAKDFFEILKPEDFPYKTDFMVKHSGPGSGRFL